LIMSLHMGYSDMPALAGYGVSGRRACLLGGTGVIMFGWN
jgi:hypothetical protein